MEGVSASNLQQFARRLVRLNHECESAQSQGRENQDRHQFTKIN